ncbi:hypothetical protein [Plantibacter flavus]|uniref:hypothetical protein n=1 Tax=Plantibacter flavus TaxID=150123 RepID=UPI0010C18840|nr:hypothetical protein [Plantibacter flavus]
MSIEETDPSDVRSATLPGDSDFMLSFLTSMSNKMGFEIGIRLFIGGSAISGTLIGGQQYFTELSKQTNPTGDDSNPAAQALSNVFDEMVSFYTAETNEEDHSTPPSFIHLKEAWTYTPGQTPLLVGLWRGRVARVDGWALGTYGQSEK